CARGLTTAVSPYW
nr:immunoglobulin heavy chain junction region [Mus musculus]